MDKKVKGFNCVLKDSNSLKREPKDSHHTILVQEMQALRLWLGREKNVENREQI